MHVLIAGAGIGGLCLAQGLRRAGISCAVYERAPGINWSGYLLHMNADGGDALRRCLPENLYELYVRTSRGTPRRDVLVLQNHLGHELTTKPHAGPPNDPVTPHTTVHRRLLCQIMLAGVEDSVHFGRRAVAYRESAEGVSLELADGSVAHGDVLVAADGINSTIRRQLLPQVETAVVRQHVLLSRAPLTDEIAKALPEAFADSFTISVDPRGTLMAAGVFRPRRDITATGAELAPHAVIDPVDDYVTVSLEPDPAGIGLDDETFFAARGAALHTVMRSAVTDWSPGLRGLVDGVDPDSIVPKTIRMVRPTSPWPTSRVTVLGDSIHAMPPMFGDGANSALRDAAELADTLTDVAHGRGELLDAVEAYETRMRARTYPQLRLPPPPPLPATREAGLRPTSI
ncbi:FAD-dependent monooxygenase [Streptomyces sp. NBC_00178]|uniref:FAD-dependent oxidoreductase n=1 Tax=Streptomyces sp. NBC_00178 TaxID=2975672 RepID=UPI002E2ADFB3|nr:NAD(P)/FAD-dependent oxidoreductase [Streptomyces sp. NBC_00178]